MMTAANGSSASSFESFTTGNALFSSFSTGAYSVEATAGARIYHTPLTAQKSPQWTYSRLKGRLIFGRDDDIAYQTQDINEAEKYWFRLVDEESGRTVWVFRIPAAFEYREDLPFFHVFKGRSRRYGLLFNDDQEAALFLQKVSAQSFGKVPHKRTHSIKNVPLKTRTTSLHPGYPIHASSISSPAPNSFIHVSHIGVGKDGVFEATKNIDPTWKTLLSNIHFRGSEPTGQNYSDYNNRVWREIDSDRDAPAVPQAAGGMTRRTSNGSSNLQRADTKRKGH